jgi:predicted DNA-binding transcriptional regulator YafY
LIFLLNREKVSAGMLAEKFEVSQRTIQRDIEILNMAGIPVVSVYGKDGGYQIPDEYKMNNQITTDADYSFIITAVCFLIIFFPPVLAEMG